MQSSAAAFVFDQEIKAAGGGDTGIAGRIYREDMAVDVDVEGFAVENNFVPVANVGEEPDGLAIGDGGQRHGEVGILVENSGTVGGNDFTDIGIGLNGGGQGGAEQ